MVDDDVVVDGVVFDDVVPEEEEDSEVDEMRVSPSATSLSSPCRRFTIETSGIVVWSPLNDRIYLEWRIHQQKAFLSLARQ